MPLEISLFVPGRLCLGGEHSDWASDYRTQNPSISAGSALVVGLQQGLHATASRIPSSLTLSSPLAGPLTISPADLLSVSRSSSPWRFSAAVAFIIRQRYGIVGLSLQITEETLPAGKGLSSSAAVSVLTVRAFSRLYALRLTTAGEMDLAYAAERITGSACGRMDQVVAIGPGRVARMHFDAELVEHRVLHITCPTPIFIVLADLGRPKDTRAILAGLHCAFPDPSTQACKELHHVLGAGNLECIDDMENALTAGNAKKLGELFTSAQDAFDNAATPFCPEELVSPILHQVLANRDILRHVYGGKGVGSQGDGAVQLVAKDYASALTLTEVLKQMLGTEPYILTIASEVPEFAPNVSTAPNPMANNKRVRTAVITAAGFGTRLFPASRSIRPKALFPIIDKDGLAKPIILHLVEQCAQAGIEKIIIVVGPDQQEERVKEVFSPVDDDLYKALKPHMRDYADRIAQLASLVEFSIQHEPKGFGHAVACAGIDDRFPFVLLLGDVVFKSVHSQHSCLMQAIEAFEIDPSRSVIGVKQVSVSEAMSYGVVRTAKKHRRSRTRVPMEEIVEKPNREDAKDLSEDGVCSIVLGPYIFTPTLMQELRKTVEADQREGGEIQLTTAMVSLLDKEGMDSLSLNGEAMDTGNPSGYTMTFEALGADPPL